MLLIIQSLIGTTASTRNKRLGLLWISENHALWLALGLGQLTLQAGIIIRFVVSFSFVSFLALGACVLHVCARFWSWNPAFGMFFLAPNFELSSLSQFVQSVSSFVS